MLIRQSRVPKISWSQICYKRPQQNGPLKNRKFSAANLALAGFPLTNALGESMPSRH